jgi:class 3 adenylate cyclase
MQDDNASASGRKPSLERRLATILMADVVGYSRMMGENEERTIEVLHAHREIFDEMLKIHRGRIFNTAGDAILAEFPSAVDAVRCATEVQSALRTRNDHLPPEQRMWFRIGVNLGDVIVQGGDLLGDGVNVAARIQTVAEPGGVCISGSVYDQIKNKLSLQFKQLGERSFKNIAQPIRTFSIEDTSPAPLLGQSATPRSKRPIAAAAAIIALIATAAGGYWMFREHEARVAAEAGIAAEGMRKAEQERKTEQERKAEQERTAEQERKAEQAKGAAETARQQLALQAELQAARAALRQAESSMKKAEQDRAAAEAAQREAKLQSELQAAKEALQKAEANEKKANQNRRTATSALQIAENAADPKTPPRAAPVKSDAEAAIARRAEAVDAKSKSAPVPGAPSARFDGSYEGRICSPSKDNPERCWKTPLTVQNGKLLAKWHGSNSSEPSYARGTISPQGVVDIVVDGFAPGAKPMAGAMNGTWDNQTIKVEGAWRDKNPMRATWKRVP